jgi:hypothetical protein
MGTTVNLLLEPTSETLIGFHNQFFTEFVISIIVGILIGIVAILWFAVISKSSKGFFKKDNPLKENNDNPLKENNDNPTLTT